MSGTLAEPSATVTTTSHSPEKLLALLLGAAGILIATATFRGGDARRSVPPPAERSDPIPASPATTGEVAGLSEVPSVDTRVLEELEADRPHRVTCSQRTNGEALNGVHLYHGTGPIAGPSDAEGALEVRGAPPGALTLWVEGWIPVEVRGEALPHEVAFDAATAALELRLLNVTSEHRFVRSLLQPRAPNSVPGSLWTPTLEERALDVYVADRLPPGTYDVYVWVALARGEPRAFSLEAVEVEAGGTTRRSIDVASPQDPEEGDDRP